jgi:type I restriction enzyme M protein
MNQKNLIQKLGFFPKENTSGLFIKKYADDYCIEVDFDKEIFNFGGKIKIQGKEVQYIIKPEDWVVFECVNRLLDKGYKPENITLEKVYPAGHGNSGRLDICVTHDNGAEYLLIECKTYGSEFTKAYNKLKKDGGQLFTYFKFSNKADLIMLYSSELKGNDIVYKNEIVKIEDEYRTGDVKDFYDKWNKLSKDNGVFDSWVLPYNFVSKTLTSDSLGDIKHEDSSFIFNRFLEILRHNVVSDKPNAFNKIFTLFLCKIYDEKINEGTENELAFQWKEGVDNHVSFQLRLTDLYKEGMWEFLEKRVTDFSDDDFETKYASLFAANESLKKTLKNEIAKLRLEKNNEFAIKEVYDEKSFNENAKVVKEVVELLQNYKIRYTKKQQYLSDFFELLLTTGLKQESGQFFTPVPIAQFIIKSLPIDKIVNEKLIAGKRDDLLPYIIDYASGSGHFVTEGMHEIQRLLNNIDTQKLKVEARSFIEIWRIRHFDWALQYIYGIEKDYRLVKVGKVGCYLHGDGLANIIHSDGLASFNHEDYKGKLKEIDKDFPQENKQFEIVISNPPYSVSSFKNASREYYKETDFELHHKLTDNSSEIECLFIERTKQLLKDGGIAGIILPDSILDNDSEINTRTREIIFKYFEIIAITEFGTNVFLATKIKTKVLFLRRKNNYESINLKNAVDKFFVDLQDVTLNRVENPVNKYVNHVWQTLSYDDYITLLKRKPNQAVTEHEIFLEYKRKVNFKSRDKKEKEFWDILLENENKKIFYFIITYPQKTVLIKSGEKEAEKIFLGYEFSKRGGSEGIHPIKGKNIEECTNLFDIEIFNNPKKASTYIYNAFQGIFDLKIDEVLKDNIEYSNLVDLLNFKSSSFDLKVGKTEKTNINYNEIWQTSNLQYLFKVAEIQKGKSITKTQTVLGSIPVIAGGQTPAYFHNKSNREGNIITVSASGAYAGFINYFSTPIFASDCNTIKSLDEKKLPAKLLYYFLKVLQPQFYQLQRGQAQPHVYKDEIEMVRIPLIDEAIASKILFDVETLEEKAKTIVINDLQEQIEAIIKSYLI